MVYHMIAFSLGCLLDLIIGDPYTLPHPIRWIGSLIGFLDKKLNNGIHGKMRLRLRGLLTVAVVLILPASVCAAVIVCAYRLHFCAGIVTEAVITFYMLAGKSLYVESMKVCRAMRKGDTEAGRQAVTMIVGRDTDVLDDEGIIKAAVETVAENTSDGVIAPLLFLALGGPVAGVVYKSVNTMDSMIGYKNEKYADFGFFAAKLDDILNFLPARISAVLMILATVPAGRDFSFKRAALVFARDRYNHASPNSAQCESVCAGALGVRLAGNASYFGKTVEKPYIGDKLRDVEAEDIARADRLMFITGFLTYILCMAIMLVSVLFGIMAR
ncbi:MAG: adenosylcobinamide-phosphate synthase CbiB [Lachnospiraceae bacterium]|nr:adenosylcobinamide-phosphate synthase CbiB [Lachnospiraceae bacterium]